jgi:hypothetical protein
MGIHPMELEYIFRSQVVDSGSPFNTIIPESKGTVGVLHIFSDSLLDQSNVEFGLVCPPGSFLENLQRDTDFIAELP